MDEISRMSLSELERLLRALENSTDPWAIGAVKLVRAEIRRVTTIEMIPRNL